MSQGINQEIQDAPTVKIRKRINTLISNSQLDSAEAQNDYYTDASASWRDSASTTAASASRPNEPHVVPEDNPTIPNLTGLTDESDSLSHKGENADYKPYDTGKFTN